MILVNNSAAKIKRLAKLAGIDIVVEGKKTVIPNDKEQLKIVLGFLDEAYKVRGARYFVPCPSGSVLTSQPHPHGKAAFEKVVFV